MASNPQLQKENGENVVETLPKRSKPAAAVSPVTDQPDGTTDHGEIYVQVTVLSKKLGTAEDGTILLSPLSESLVS